jgi:hypothetical protein
MGGVKVGYGKFGNVRLSYNSYNSIENVEMTPAYA